MQFKAFLVSTFIVVVAAQDVSSLTAQLPTCAFPCLAEAATTTGCDIIDYSCQCTNMAAIETSSATCLTSNCSVADIGTTQTVTTEICKAVSGTSSSNSTSDSTSSTSSTSSTTTGTSTGSSTSSSASATSTTGSNGAAQLSGLGWLGLVGLVGAMVL